MFTVQKLCRYSKINFHNYRQNKVCKYNVDFNSFRVKMCYTFRREPNVFTIRVNFSQKASILTFSVNIFSHLALIFFTFSYLFTYRGIFTSEGVTHMPNSITYI